MSRELLVAALQGKPIEFTLAGQPVQLRPLTAADVAQMRAYQDQHGDDAGYRFAFVRSVLDIDGARMFTDADAELVSSFNGCEVARVNAKIAELNRLDDSAGKVPSPTIQS